MLAKEELKAQIRAMGIQSSDTVLVHSALRAVGPVPSALASWEMPRCASWTPQNAGKLFCAFCPGQTGISAWNPWRSPKNSINKKTGRSLPVFSILQTDHQQ